MTRNPLHLALALAAVLALSLLPLLSLPAAAAPAQPARAHLAPPPPPPPGGHTYFYCNWLGNWVRLKHVPNVSVERFGDAAVVGKCQSLRTNDKYYKRLIGRNINVFFAPRQYPGVLVVHNGRQGHQPVFGTWTFPLAGAASAKLSGTVTDSGTGTAIPGATVSARKCVAKPTQHCTILTDVTNAKGQYTLQFFQFGKWQVTATATGYSSGGSVTASITSGKNSILNVALVRQPTNLTLSLGVTPSPATVSAPTTVTVTLSQAVNDGTVTFSSTGTATGTFSATTCTPSAGTCSVQWTPSTPGTATITAAWSGDTLYNAATNTATVTVNGLSTTLTLTASPSPATTGQPVTLTATLGTTTSGGTVTFSGSGPGNAVFPTQTCTPAGGTCQVTWQASAPGTWSITATWSGAGAYGPATGTTTLTVNPATASMTLTANPSAPQSGQATVLTATLSVPASDGTITFTGTGPTGSTFTQQTCFPSSGSCHISWTPTAAGTWSITATWSGDTQYPSGAQAGLQVVVGSGTIAISLTATPNPAILNQSDTLTATLTQPVSDGTVLFTGVGPNNATFPQISCVPSGGTCSKTWTPTVAGQWQISAYWSGDAQYPNPVITNIQLTVSSSSTGLTVTAQPSSVTAGHLDQLTAQLSGSATGGTIQFSGVGPNNQAFTASPSSCAPTTGSCSIFWTAPANGAGTWHITANWTGPNGQTGTGTTSVTVNAPGFLTVNETPNPLQVSHTGTVTATVQTASSGLVTFTGSGPNGQSYTASCTLNNSLTCTASPAFTPTTVGTWTIGASFFTAGNDYTDSTLVEVTGTPTTLTLTAAPNPPTVGQPTTLTASISPSVSDGSVVFSGVGPSGQSFVVNPSSCTPSAGSCPVTWTPTATGSWTITASWSGDSTHAPSSNQITVTVSTGNLSISSDPASPIAGSSATLTATLAFNTSSASTIAWSGTGPSGQSLTQFVSQPTCPITTGGNQCSVTWTPDAPGNWTIKATWSGDSTHQNGDTATVTITVGSAFFTVTLSPSPPETLNSTVIATAKIADTSVNDGEVDFYFTKPDNTTVVETCPQPQQGTCSSDPVTLDQSGQWTLLTVWNGDTQYPAGATSSITFNVS